MSPPRRAARSRSRSRPRRRRGAAGRPRARCRRVPPSFSAGWRWTAEASSAGAMPKPLRRAAPRRRSRARCADRGSPRRDGGCPGGASASSSRSPHAPERDAGDAARRGEDERLGQELADRAASGRAEGRAQGHLALASRGAREEHVATLAQAISSTRADGRRAARAAPAGRRRPLFPAAASTCMSGSCRGTGGRALAVIDADLRPRGLERDAGLQAREDAQARAVAVRGPRREIAAEPSAAAFVARTGRTGKTAA